MPRRALLAASIAVSFGLTAGGAVSLAGVSPAGTPVANGPLAQFAACMKAHGAPTLGVHAGADHARSAKPRSLAHNGILRGVHRLRGPLGGLSAADREALKQAFAACRAQLPKLGNRPDSNGPRSGDEPRLRFHLPSAQQVAAFRACMAGKGFAAGRPGGIMRADVQDPALRASFKAALEDCMPLLRPAAKPS